MDFKSLNNIPASEYSNCIGGFLAFGAALLSNFGVNIQKSFHQSQSRSLDKKSLNTSSCNYCLNLMWWYGYILIMIGAFGDFIALAFARQSIVAAVGGGTTLIANVAFAHYMNKETVLKTDLLGVGFIILAVVVLAVIVDPAENYNIQQLKNMILATPFLVYCGVQILGLIYVYFILIERADSISTDNHQQVGYGYYTLNDLLRNWKRCGAKNNRKSIALYYAGMSGVVGGMSVLLGKCAAEMLARTFTGNNQLIYYQFYLFIIGIIITIILQTKFLNTAIALGDVMTAFPVFQVFWIGFSVIGGIIFYKEYNRFTIIQWFLYPVTLCLVIVGIYFLGQHRRNYQQEPNEHLVTKIQSEMEEPLLG